MKNTRTIWLSALSLLCLTSAMAHADHKMIQGRTGLPTVREGGDKIWMESGVVKLKVSGNALTVTQGFRLHYPGSPLEKAARRVTIAVREDFYRATDHNAPQVTEEGARGFTAFDVTMDGRKISSTTEPWKLNEKKDTATRWRTWTVTFQPDQVRQMRIVSRAPLGMEANRKYVQFVSKDLSAWRGAPDRLEIRFSAPGTAEAHLAALEPRPDNVNSNAVQWVYRKSRPHRDIYLQMPVGYGRVASRH